MESEGFWAVLTGLVGAVVPGLSGGSKKTKAAVAELQGNVNKLYAENQQQSKMIMLLVIGVGVLAFVVVFFVLLKRRRG